MRMDELCEGAIAVAQAAAEAILHVYRGEFDVEHKRDASPLTAADLAAHHCIVNGLAKLTPDVPVLSEEAANQVP
ncbi:inositol monophosphatase family protein, partial [Acinetobacter baumannii]